MFAVLGQINISNKRKRKEVKHEQKYTSRAIIDHLNPPNLEHNSKNFCSSSLLNGPFFTSGLRLLYHLKRQLFPQCASPVFFDTSFQFLAPCFSTYDFNISSSSSDYNVPFFNLLLVWNDEGSMMLLILINP